jgi:hypothetical protein
MSDLESSAVNSPYIILALQAYRLLLFHLKMPPKAGPEGKIKLDLPTSPILLAPPANRPISYVCPFISLKIKRRIAAKNNLIIYKSLQI